MPGTRNDILQGTLALLILKTLDSRGLMHGYALTTHIQRVSNDLLRVEEGSLYPALHRMEQQGWLRAEWGLTDKRRAVEVLPRQVSQEQQRAHEQQRRRGGGAGEDQLRERLPRDCHDARVS